MVPSRRGIVDADVERTEQTELEADEEEVMDHRAGVGQSYASQIPTDRIWTMYNAKAASHDAMLITRLKGSMDSIIVFAGLFSAVVTAFIVESYKALSVDSGKVTVFYLTQISQQLAGLHDVSLILPAVDPPTFEPSRLDVVVNTLWILSLIFSLACALGSTLIQTWTNRYLRRISRAPDAIQRARDRAWYFDGIKKSQMESLADGVPALLHIALFLFLAGLVVFLIPINHDIAHSAMAVSLALAVIYLVLAVSHIFVPKWPYYTPLSLAMAGICLIAVSSIPFALYVSFSVIVATTAVAAIPLLLLGYFTIKLLQHWFGINTISSPVSKLFNDLITPRIIGNVLHPHEMSDRFQSDGRHSKQDIKVLVWLLQQTNSISELEGLIEGVEPLVDRDENRARGAKFVLEVGGTSVGTFTKKFGHFVGILIHSCSQQTDLPLEDRHRRITACTRAILSVFTHTTSKERTADTFIPLTGMISWLPREQRTLFLEEVPIRWRQWVTSVTLQGINNMRLAKDPLLAFTCHCLAAILLHRSLCDIAYRIDIGEVVLEAPTQWNVGSILRAFRGIRKPELFELFVAVSTAAETGEKPSNVSTSFGIPRGQWPWKARPITVTFTPDELEENEEVTPVVSHTLRNEATLLALHNLLDHVSSSALAPSIAHCDLFSRTISALLVDGSGSDTSADLQRNFLNLLLDVYTDSSDRNEVPDASFSGFSTQEYLAHSLLHSQEVLDLLVPFVETLDDTDCSPLIMKVRQLLRPPRHTTSPEPSISPMEDEVVVEIDEVK